MIGVAKKHSMCVKSRSRVIFITATMMGREARSRWRAFSHACAVMREMTVLYCHRHRAFFVVKIIHIIKKKVRAIFDPTHHHRECLMGRVVSVSCLLALTDCSESFGGVRKTFFWIVCRHCC